MQDALTNAEVHLEVAQELESPYREKASGDGRCIMRLSDLFPSPQRKERRKLSKQSEKAKFGKAMRKVEAELDDVRGPIRHVMLKPVGDAEWVYRVYIRGSDDYVGGVITID